MHSLLLLWLPILLSAVVVFVISSVVHMVIKWHAPDYKGLPNEEAVRTAIRSGNPAPGRYVVPYCSDMKEMGSEAMLTKYREGPVGHITLAPNAPFSMGRGLGLWFVWCLMIAAVAAVLASQLVPFEPAYARKAAKLVGAVTFIANGFGTITESIWSARPWSSSVKYILDAALYAVGSGLVFYWFWH